jgi:hypothetical protein
MGARFLVLAWAVLAVAAAPTLAAAPALAEQPPDETQWVSRQEYEAMKKDFDAMKARLDAVEAGANDRVIPPGEYFDTLDKDLARIKSQLKANEPGSTMFLFTGEAFAGFTNQKGSPNTFSAGFAPLFLLQVNKRLLLEAGLDIGLVNDLNGQNPGTDISLSLANLSYVINDRLTVGGGLFTVPFGRYHSHFDAKWIDKLPDDPLVFGDNGIAPGSGVGVFATGAAPLGTNSLVNYSLYVINGPVLDNQNADTAGSLIFDNFQDSNNNKAVGGRIGFQPFPALEIGYSFMYAHPGTAGFKEVKALLQAVDINYVHEVAALKGTVTARAEWVFSHVDKATYGPDADTPFGPLTFDNDRSGGYVLLAYRPTKSTNDILRKTEFVLRYDRLDVPSGAPGGGHEQRWTPGIAYWIGPSAVLKVAYEFDQKQGGRSDNALLMMFAVSF